MAHQSESTRYGLVSCEALRTCDHDYCLVGCTCPHSFTYREVTGRVIIVNASPVSLQLYLVCNDPLWSDHSQKSTHILGLSVCSVRSQAAAQQQPTPGEECREQTAQVTIIILMRRAVHHTIASFGAWRADRASDHCHGHCLVLMLPHSLE